LEPKISFLPISQEKYLSLFQQKNPKFYLEKWSELFSLPLKKTVEEYSSSMKKKLALLAQLKMDKSIFLLDEPFNGVDMETSRIFEVIFKEMAKKVKLRLLPPTYCKQPATTFII
jgi:ABC-2 type transport system ATP-binding protein